MNDSLQYFSTVIYDIFQRSSANCANRAIVRYVQFERKCLLVSFKFLFLLSTTINQDKSYCCTHFLLQGFQAVIGKCSCNTLLGLHQNLLSFVDRGIILEPSNLHCKQQSTAILQFNIQRVSSTFRNFRCFQTCISKQNKGVEYVR